VKQLLQARLRDVQCSRLRGVYCRTMPVTVKGAK
jgi:hypothetical protein